MSSLSRLRTAVGVATHPLRVMTAQSRRLPTFIVMGTQKGGTTYLFDLMRGHPRVFSSTRKEVHFFDVNFTRGEAWYRGHFPTSAEVDAARKAGPVAISEASPYYMFHPKATERILNLIPEVKLIYVLRDPAKRALSHYYHNVRKGREPLSWEDAVKAEPERLAGEVEKMLADPAYNSPNHQHFSYVARGLYIDQIEAATRFTDRSNILILKSETLFKEREASVARVCRFLGLPEWTPATEGLRNKGDYRGEERPDLSELNKLYEPANDRLYEFIQHEWKW